MSEVSQKVPRRHSEILSTHIKLSFVFKIFVLSFLSEQGRVAQPVTCLAKDASLTADLGVASSISVRSHTFVEIDHEMISMVILLPLNQSRRVVVSYKRKYVHEVLYG